MALPQPSRPRLIENLIRILRNVGFEPSSSDLADIIWLAGYLDAPPEPLLQQERSGTQLPSLPEKEQSPSPSKEQDTPPSVTKAESPSSPSSAGLFTNESSGLFLTTPGGSALPGKLSISRALRPLMRRAPSLNLKEIDEDATVQRIADENNWTPILRPELSRWLELDLLIDTWPSMVIWQPAIRELFQLLEQQGAFQTIRYWEMETNEHHHSVHLYAGLRENQGSSRSPKELVEIRGNRLILVVCQSSILG